MNAVKPIRKRIGLTQEALAVALGTVQGNIGSIERGDHQIKADMALVLVALAGKHGLRIGLDHVYGVKELPAARKAKRK